jgi:hypothetical protein
MGTVDPVHETVHSVMYCDDLEGEASYTATFEQDAESRACEPGPRRRLEVDGPVIADPEDLIDELTRRHDVIDNQFVGRDPEERPEKLAFATLRTLARRFHGWNREMPPMVLTTMLDDMVGTLDCFSWVQLGGTHVIDKGTMRDGVAVLWEVVDGMRWQPPPPPEPKVDLNKGHQEVILPPLEAGFGQSHIVRWLMDQPSRPRPRHKSLEESCKAAVHNAVHDLGHNELLLDHVRAINPGWTSIEDGAPRRDLALGAARAGYLFVRLKYR